jgi:hypothetical protein
MRRNKAALILIPSISRNWPKLHANTLTRIRRLLAGIFLSSGFFGVLLLDKFDHFQIFFGKTRNSFCVIFRDNFNSEKVVADRVGAGSCIGLTWNGLSFFFKKNLV